MSLDEHRTLPMAKNAKKLKTAVFRVKSHFAWRTSATKFLCVLSVSDSLAYLSVQKMIGGDVPLYVKIWRILSHPLQNADFHSILVRTISAVAPSKKFH